MREKYLPWRLRIGTFRKFLFMRYSRRFKVRVGNQARKIGEFNALFLFLFLTA